MVGQVVSQVRQVNTIAFKNTTKVVLSLVIYVLTLAVLFPPADASVNIEKMHPKQLSLKFILKSSNIKSKQQL
jgi:hypothetical protein